MTNAFATVIALSLPSADPTAELRAVQAARVAAADELFAVAEKLYRVGAVSGMDYQNARLRMLAVKIDAAATPDEKLGAMQDRVDACAARVKYLTTPGVVLNPIEAQGVIPVARVELAEARFAVTPRRDDREAIVRETLKGLAADEPDPKAVSVLSRTEVLELRSLRLSLKARLLGLLDE